MNRAPAPDPNALPPLEVLRLVAGLVAAIFAQVLPALVHRPDLRMPLLRATRALASAGWAYAWGRDRDALRAATLALIEVLRAVVAEEAVEAAPPCPRSRRAPPAMRGRDAPVRGIGPRARDGPRPA